MLSFHNRFKNRLKKKARIKIKLKRFLVFIILVLTTLSFCLIQQNLFSIKSVEIKLTQTSCIDKDILKKEIDLYGKNLIFLKRENIILGLKNKFICIRDVKISKFLPSKVRINIEGRQAFAKLKRWKNIATDSATISSEQVFNNVADESDYIIDEDGVIFSKDPRVDIMEIYIPDQLLETGQEALTLKIENVKLFTNKLAGFGISINRLIMFGQRSLLFDSNPKIFINVEGNIDLQLASLQLILEEAKINEEAIEFIDLRYDKPIVKIAHKKE